MLKFEEYHTNRKDELRDLFEAIGDRSGHYLYFVVYRSPLNPKQSCLYTGIKYREDREAKNFWGSLRYNPKTRKSEIKDQKVWRKGLVYFDPTTEEIETKTEASTGIYMSSAAENSGSQETLAHALKKGIVDNVKTYHPIICTTDVIDHVAELAGTYRENVLDNLQRLGKKLKKENFPSGNVTKTAIPLTDKKFHETNDYGYRIYVCENMNGYKDFLNVFLDAEDNTSDEQSELRTGFKKGVEAQGSRDGTFDEKQEDSILQQVENFYRKYSQSIINFYDERTEYRLPKEFENGDNFEKHLLSTYKDPKNQSLRVGKAEYDIIKSTQNKDIGNEKVQGQSTMINLPMNRENLSKYFFAFLPEKERDALLDYMKIADKAEKPVIARQKKYSVSDFETLSDMYLQKVHDDTRPSSFHFRRSASTFVQDGKKSESGIVTDDGSIYKLLYNSEDPKQNFLMLAKAESDREYSESPARQKVKQLLDRFELPLIYREMGSLSMQRLVIKITKKDNLYYVKNDLGLEKIADFENNFEQKQIKEDLPIVAKYKELFTFWDLLTLINAPTSEGGYDIEGLSSKNNLTQSPVDKRTGRQSFFSKNKKLIQPWWIRKVVRKKSNLNNSFEIEDYDRFLSEELLDEGIRDAFDSAIQKVGELYKLTKEQLLEKKKRLTEILQKSERYDAFAMLFPTQIMTGQEKFNTCFLEIDGKVKKVTQEQLTQTLQELANVGIRKKNPKLYQQLKSKAAGIAKKLLGSKLQTSSNEDSRNVNAKRRVRTFKEITKNK